MTPQEKHDLKVKIATAELLLTNRKAYVAIREQELADLNQQLKDGENEL